MAERPWFICLQETKMASIIAYDVMQIAGAGFDDSFLLVAGTRGGILLPWKPSVWAVTHIRHRTFSISARVKLLADESEM